MRKKTLKEMTLEELKAEFDRSMLDIDKTQPDIDLGALADHQTALLKEINRRSPAFDVAGNPLNGILTQDGQSPDRKREKIGGIEV